MSRMGNLEYRDILDSCIHSNRTQTVITRNSTVRRIINHYSEFSSTPLISLRKTAWRNALREWEWFLSGSNQIEDLHESVRDWWKPWASPTGIVQHNYSRQFRYFYGWESEVVDQIAYLIKGIQDHPFSRRNVITTWNTADMASPDTPITNCHGTVIQAFVEPAAAVDGRDGVLSIFTYQRSVDVICGLPHNWIQYWAFLQWLAYQTGKKVGKLMWMGGDVHVYEQHLPLAEKICSAQVLSPPPELVYTPPAGEVEFRAEHFSLSGEYVPVLSEKAEMVV